MPSKKYAAPLALEPRPSTRLRRFFLIALCGALLLPLLVPASGWLRALLWGAALIIGAAAWRRSFGRERIVSAQWDEAGAWHLAFADGSECEGELAGESFVSPEMLLLTWRTPAGLRHLVVLSDVMDAEMRRRLRVRLRLEGGRGANGEGARPV